MGYERQCFLQARPYERSEQRVDQANGFYDRCWTTTRLGVLTLKVPRTRSGHFHTQAATMQLIVPGGETAKNSLEQPDNIKIIPPPATVKRRVVKFTMPPLSAGVVRVTP
jgi:hypothetical protein